MTRSWHPATPEELTRVWPALRTTAVAKSPDDLRVMYEQAPWRVRVSDKGDVLVLRRWREHMDLLAIRAAVSPQSRTPALLVEAIAVAKAQGFSGVISPLIAEKTLAPYLESGFTRLATLVALTGQPPYLARLPEADGISLSRATMSDVDELARVDSECFPPFWHYGKPELEEAVARERVTVARREGRVLGYSTASIFASTCTLGRLAVSSEARRLGVGTALVRDVAGWAEAMGSHSLSLCTQVENAGARGFYRRTGLAELPETYALAMLSWAEPSPDRLSRTI